MPHPKRKNSKQRVGKRRSANSKMTLPQLCECPQCAEPYIPHRVCPACGYYKGRAVVSVDAMA